MKNSQDCRKLTFVEAKKSDVKEVFKNEKIAEHYQKVRNSTTVESYYQDMIEAIMMDNKDNHRVKELLCDENIQRNNEKILMKIILNIASEKMREEGQDTLEEDVVMSLITQESLLKAIDELGEIMSDGVDEFCEEIVEEIINKVGLEFVD